MSAIQGILAGDLFVWEGTAESGSLLVGGRHVGLYRRMYGPSFEEHPSHRIYWHYKTLTWERAVVPWGGGHYTTYADMKTQVELTLLQDLVLRAGEAK